jgi:hypothetical protein
MLGISFISEDGDNDLTSAAILAFTDKRQVLLTSCSMITSHMMNGQHDLPPNGNLIDW